MILNLGSAIFNAETASGGGTPAWGTEMGQGDGYRFKFEDYESLITSLVYNSIPNPGTRIYCPLKSISHCSQSREILNPMNLNCSSTDILRTISLPFLGTSITLRLLCSG